MLLLRILFGLTAVLGVTGANNDDWTWSLVFDAGSSGTRINIFKILKESGKPDVFQQFIPSNKNDEDKLKVKPGLSGHLLAGKLGDVRADIAKLLAEAARWVPKNKQANTPVRLGATAGLRLLTIAQQNDVINAAANALADKSINPFKNYGAFIMSGEEEALFGWLAVNYFLEKFNTFDPAGTVGALDLGGASTQIAYNSPGQILEGQQSAVVNGNRYRIYGTSFLKFGNDQFEAQVFNLIKSKSKTTSSKAQPYDNPCQCKGFAEEHDKNFFLGSGKWDACASLIEEIFNIDNQPCVFTNGIGRCSILGKYLAPKAKNFYAFAAYFYAASGLGLLGWNDAKKLSPNQFKTAGTTWCAATKTTFSDPYKKDYCRQSAYIYTLLTKAYHFQGDDATSITFARKVNGFSVSWALGMAMSYAPSSTIAQVTTQAGLDPPVCQRKNMVTPGYRCAANEYNSRAEVEELCKRTASCTGYAQVGLTNEKGSYYLYGPAPVDEKLDPQGVQHSGHQCYKRYDKSTGTEFKALSWKGGCHVGPHTITNFLCQDIGACRKTSTTTATSTTTSTRRKTPTAPSKICKSVGDPHVHPFVKPDFVEHSVGLKTLYQKLDLIIKVYQRRWVDKTSGGPKVAVNTAVSFSLDGGKTYSQMSKGEVLGNKNPVFNVVGDHGKEATSQRNFPNYFLDLTVTARDFKALSGSAETNIIYDVHITTNDYAGATGQCVEGKRRRLGDSGGVAYPTGADVKVTKAEAEQACASITDLALRANCVTDLRMYNDPKANEIVAAAYVSVQKIDNSLAKKHGVEKPKPVTTQAGLDPPVTVTTTTTTTTTTKPGTGKQDPLGTSATAVQVTSYAAVALTVLAAAM